MSWNERAVGKVKAEDQPPSSHRFLQIGVFGLDGKE